MSFVAVAVGAGLGIGGTIISNIGANDAAEAQGNIAKDQLAAANKAVGMSAPTLEEMNTLNKQIQFYENSYSSAQNQLNTLKSEIENTYGRNVLELGNQLYGQLKGQDSGVAAAAKKGIDLQREKLKQSLLDKMGPGALTSSAGIQALNNFDMQAEGFLAQQREQSLNRMISNIGSLQGGQSTATQGILGINNQLMGMLNQIQGTQGNLQTRQVNTILNTIPQQGAQYVEDLQKGKALANTGGQIAGIGGNVLGIGIGQGIKNAGSGGGNNLGADMFATSEDLTMPEFGSSSPFANKADTLRVGDTSSPFGKGAFNLNES